MAPRDQWITTTASRIATDPYSWMQSVHWLHGAGIYQPARSHGPRFGETTVRLAQALAELSPCRPGVDYLARKLKMSERSVQYHLGMLREAGLLAYVFKGTRASGMPNQASEFARVIPPAFDTALGIRTTGEGVQRRPVGIAEEHRGTIGKLAKKAARKVRRTRSRKPSTKAPRCTPMQGGTSTSSTAGTTHCPSESKLASGTSKSPTPKKAKRGQRTLNKVGRRYQLARELIQRVDWMHRAATPRIAWIVAEVADAGWTADEVIAYLATTAEPKPEDTRRPSGLLGYRLKGVTQLPGWRTPEQRAQAVQQWRDSRRAAKARRAEYEGDWQAPSSPAVRRIVHDAMTGVRQATTGTADVLEITLDTAPVDLESLPRSVVVDMRRDAEKDPALIHLAIETAGETYARRLYTNALVDRALRPVGSHMRINTWQEASYV